MKKKAKEPKGICIGCVNYTVSEFQVLIAGKPVDMDSVKCSVLDDATWFEQDNLHKDRLLFVRSNKVLKCKWFLKRAK